MSGDKAFYFSKEFKNKQKIERLKEVLRELHRTGRVITTEKLQELTGMSYLSLRIRLSELRDKGYRIRSINVYQVLEIPEEEYQQNKEPEILISLEDL
ncbi:hypothetical protein J7M23_05805 [Candidatus Sumerlaeota bacterium]|nr:hypothetical protein [Candidatus Sumerlaeota bacterium]